MKLNGHVQESRKIFYRTWVWHPHFCNIKVQYKLLIRVKRTYYLGLTFFLVIKLLVYKKRRKRKDYLETIWSGSWAYETARTTWSRSRSILTGATRRGLATGSAPIGRADFGACGPPPIRYTNKSLKFAIFECGERSFAMP